MLGRAKLQAICPDLAIDPKTSIFPNGYGDSHVQKDAPNAGTSSVPTGSLSAPEAGQLTTPLAGPFREAFAGLEEQRWSDQPDNPYNQCFGCGPRHPTGLHVRSFKTANGVASPIVIPRQYDGPPGAAHGGIVAAYLDEVLAATVLRTMARMAVTGELTIRYMKPVPTETPIIGRGSLLADHGRYVDVEGRLEELRTGNVLATARGRFFPV
jgi:acyl-coenzyme A thioesterase PaaI-like protein